MEFFKNIVLPFMQVIPNIHQKKVDTSGILHQRGNDVKHNFWQLGNGE